jgi:pimeloyl-ACP methyl ester carboxylesterase
MTREEELRASARLIGRALSGTVDVVGDVHRAIGRRVAGLLPPVASPAIAAHDAIADAAYSAVSVALRLVSAAGGEALAVTCEPGAPPPSQTRVGSLALSAVNGLWGDTLAEGHPALAFPMTVRAHGRDVPLDRASIAAAFPEARPRLVVFLHGLAESDASWWLHTAAVPETAGSYGDRLQRDLGLTPVYLRYNTGLRVSDNGRALSRLLVDLVEAWPVPASDILLIGHSMGGLVARSACHDATARGEAWVASVRTIVTLGTPHLGAPLEKAVHVTQWLLSRFPETAPLARPLQARSVGVKDLRYGNIVEEDWLGHDPDELLRDRCTEVPLLDHVTYYFVAACLTRDPEHPAGRLVGDGLVRYPSASGRGRTRHIPFAMDNGAHIGGIGHLSLLNHPDVYRQILTWLTPAGPVGAD